MTLTPFALLCALAREPGTLLRKDALLDAVWGHRFVSESVLKTAISDLRLALGDNPRQPSFIETVSRHGYRFIASTPREHSCGSAPAQAAVPDVDARVASPFVGRTAALSKLHGAWQRGQDGQRALVWLAGEPGMGKTTLIEQFVGSLAGVACARGHCVEHFGTSEPYLPVLEALAELCRSDPALPELLRTVAPTWLLQLPWLCSVLERDALRRELAGVGPERMLREMGELLERYTEQRPLLLVTEDLHWSDRATVQLIAYLARRRGRIRLMWLASFRAAEVVALDHPLGSLRHELRLQRLCDEIMLDPFSETEVADYVAQTSLSLARDEFYYFNDDGQLVAMRYGDWKLQFCEQLKPGGFDVWSEPFVCLRIPRLFNLRMDPYETADIVSNQYNDWVLKNSYLISLGHMKAAQFLQTFIEWPPSQRPAGFSIEQVQQAVNMKIAEKMKQQQAAKAPQ